MSLFLLKLDHKSLVINKSLEQVARENPDIHFRAVAIHRNSTTIIPSGKDVFIENDLAYVITQPDDIERLLRLSGKVNFRISKIIIAGGSRIGRKSATVLQNYKNVTIIDKSDERIEQLSDILTKSLIVKGDVRNIDMLLEEGIETTDAFIAVTNSSETNILTSLLAKKFNVPRIITLVENIEFIDIAQKVGLDAIINKKLITASYITKFILSEKVSTVKYLTGADAEALELIVKPNAPITKKPICELDFPNEAIIGGYIRSGKGFIALGKSQIRAGDKVVVFVMPKDMEKVMTFFE
ncbi:MAG: Trk system potassium uptake protein TrkA [Bacteroidetes bacterium ADurb.Bin408]|nr:MAG: Trk system potassium uptake protein TrkA [Bacteroidetes bacterium ADurb.Bin408]